MGAVPFLNLLGAVPSCSLLYERLGLQAWGLSRLLRQTHSQFPIKEGLPHKEEGEEEEMEEEDDSSYQLCVPGIATLQPPLHKTFRSTDTVGKRSIPTVLPNMPQAQGVPFWCLSLG